MVWLSGLRIFLLKQNVTSSIPSQDTCLGCGPDPLLGANERQLHINVSLSLSPSLPLSLKNKY